MRHRMAQKYAVLHIEIFSEIIAANVCHYIYNELKNNRIHY